MPLVNKNKIGTIIKLNEGIVGQTAATKKEITLNEIPEDYIKINTSFGDISPQQLITVLR